MDLRFVAENGPVVSTLIDGFSRPIAFDTRHVFAVHDAQERRQDASLLATGAKCAHGLYRRTALSDLLQLDDLQVNKGRLYRGLDELFEHKAALEAHLSKRYGELFAVENEVLLYDVTSTYMVVHDHGSPRHFLHDGTYARRASRRSTRVDRLGLARHQRGCNSARMC